MMTKEQMLQILMEVSKGNKSPEIAQNELLGLFSVSSCDFTNAKVGDYLRCDKVYSQSKKYTVGNTYQIIKERNDRWYGLQIAIRDDNKKITWIERRGISYTEFTVLSCR